MNKGSQAAAWRVSNIISRRQLSPRTLKSQQVLGQLLTDLNLPRKHPTFCQLTLYQAAKTQLLNSNPTSPPQKKKLDKGYSASNHKNPCTVKTLQIECTCRTAFWGLSELFLNKVWGNSLRRGCQSNRFGQLYQLHHLTQANHAAVQFECAI